MHWRIPFADLIGVGRWLIDWLKIRCAGRSCCCSIRPYSPWSRVHEPEGSNMPLACDETHWHTESTPKDVKNARTRLARPQGLSWPFLGHDGEREPTRMWFRLPGS